MRLPKAYRFESTEVRIRRHGNAVILEPVAKDWSWLNQVIGPVDEDFQRALIEKPSEQKRPELSIFQ